MLVRARASHVRSAQSRITVNRRKLAASGSCSLKRNYIPSTTFTLRLAQKIRPTSLSGPGHSANRSVATMAPPRLETMAISIEHSGVGLLKFNRPKAANALTPQAMEDYVAALEWALDEPSVKVVVVTGEGKFYSTGLDLMGVPKDGPVIPDKDCETLRKLHEVLIKAEKVLIAAVNGPAVGHGTSCTALYDLVYSVPDAFFTTPFARLGISAEACSSVSFMRIMGRQKASALILAGERLTPQEMESAGLVTKILPKDGFLDEVMKIAKRIADQPTEATKFNKHLLMQPIRQELLNANEVEMVGLRERVRMSEARQAVNAFQEEQSKKKKPAKL